MVKGVNKTVIEVNNTGSKVFDKIVFYVSPSCGNLSAKNLNRAIKNFTFQLDERAGKGYATLRRRHIIRRNILLASLGVILAATVTVLLVVL